MKDKMVGCIVTMGTSFTQFLNSEYIMLNKLSIGPVIKPLTPMDLRGLIQPIV